MQNLHLLEYSAESFRCHVHHFQSFAVPVALAVMGFVFPFIVVVIAEMFIRLACVTRSIACEFCKFIDHLVWFLACGL